MADQKNDVVWEPPVAGDETSTLLGSLERQRDTFAWIALGWTLRVCRRPSARRR